MWLGTCRVTVLVLCLCGVLHIVVAETRETEYLNSFIVKLHDDTHIEAIAREHGFTIQEKIADLNIYHLTHSNVAGRSKRADENYLSRMKDDPRVKLVEQQKVLHRYKRTHNIVYDKQIEFPVPDIRDNSKYFRAKDQRDNIASSRFNDEYYNDQWYLHNDGQTGAKRDIDINVVPAWEMGFTGLGSVVSILDDGFDHEHPDLRENYDPQASADFNDLDDKKNDPVPDKSTSLNSHGTRCAGEVAGAAGNGICGVGVAYNAKVGGIRMLDGIVTDVLEAKALVYHKDHIDIKSASWGPHDDGKTMETPNTATIDALEEAVKTGRKGKGTVFVWATGNGGNTGDNCGADGYVSSIESISVQSMSPEGKLPFFGEVCTSTMVSVPSGGEVTAEAELNAIYRIKVVTTDINGGCVENFEGTSSAAPLASGCLALVLQANPDLTWRDVQHIVAEGARIPGSDVSWVINGAGFHVNAQFGFGMMDCAKMVQLAQNWVNKPEQHKCETDEQTVDVDIPVSGCHNLQFDFDGCADDKRNIVTSTEHVQLHLKIQPVRRGNINIFLTSPSGTRSEVLRPRENDDTDEPIDFTFMTVHKWGENPAGQWTLEVCDKPVTQETNPQKKSAGHFESWSLRVSGFYDPESKPSGRARSLTEDQVESIVQREFKQSRSLAIKRDQSIKDIKLSSKDNENKDANVDEYVKSLDRAIETFKGTFGVRSIENFLSDYIDHSSNFDQLNVDTFDNDNLADKRGFAADKKNNEEDGLKRELIKILMELDTRKTEDGDSYLDVYIERKRELLLQQKVRDLIDRVTVLLDNEQRKH